MVDVVLARGQKWISARKISAFHVVVVAYSFDYESQAFAYRESKNLSRTELFHVLFQARRQPALPPRLNSILDDLAL